MAPDDELSFCPQLQQMINSGSTRLASGEIVKTAGTSTRNNLLGLRRLIHQEQPKRTLEIGLAYGASALAFLATLREVHPDGKFHHIAIDAYQESSWRSAGVAVIRQAGLSRYFTCINEDSAIALPRLCSEGHHFDMIYVDGSHLFEDVILDCIYSTRLLSLGGLILFDDCTDQHVNKVIRFATKYWGKILQEEKALLTLKTKQKLGTLLGRRQLKIFRKINLLPQQWNADFEDF